MELHAAALQAGLDEEVVDAAMDGDDPRATLLALLEQQQRPAADEPSEEARLAAALASGSREEREAAYATIEGVVRGAASTPGESNKPQALALAVACARPLVVSVLSASASDVGRDEYIRASVLLREMTKLDMVAVCAEMWRKDDEDSMPFIGLWTSKDTCFAAMLAKGPSGWNADDAILAASNLAGFVPLLSAGISAVLVQAGVGEVEWMGAWMQFCPYIGDNPQSDCLPLGLLLLDLLRSDTQPEAVIAGAGLCLCWIVQFRPPAGKAVYEAGFLEVFKATMQRHNPMERISKHCLVASGIMCAFKDVVEGAQGAGLEVIQPLLDAGALDIAISSLTAYQMLGKPDDAGVIYLTWGVLHSLEILLGSAQARPIVVAKLRSAGVDSLRYMLDHPLVTLGDFGQGSGAQATRVAALVWGRDDDAGGLTFKQVDIDTIVHYLDHRGPAAAFGPMMSTHGHGLLNLCISDQNKLLLLASKGFIPLIVDSLLLDPEHPRRAQPDFDAVSPPVQRDFAEAIAQLAMFAPGREALLQDQTVTEALQQVAVEGLTEEARMHAQSALLAMSDAAAAATHEAAPPQQDDDDQKHVMMSCAYALPNACFPQPRALSCRVWLDGTVCFAAPACCVRACVRLVESCLFLLELHMIL
jgi:hypothetical protein